MGKNDKLIIIGLEKSIGMSGDYPPVLQDLNFVRDAFTASVPHPILFILPDYAITRLAKYAPDFWAWGRKVFHFETGQLTREEAIQQTIGSDRMLDSLELSEKQERIDLLQRLLMKYSPSGYSDTGKNLKTRINILIQLGQAYFSQGGIAEAREHLEQALELANDNENLASLKANSLHELGIIKVNQGEFQDAIALFKQSLELQRRLGDVQAEAVTLNSLAAIYVQQGKIEQAIVLLQRSLKLQQRLGDVQGEAATLSNLAGTHVYKEEIEKAIALFQRSLDLTQRIGDVQNKAATLAMLGQLFADKKGELETALNYLQQALDILQRLQSPEAETVSRILDRVKRDSYPVVGKNNERE
ncbi:tetratricopeptide repeat protein [Coleofasciculus sp.]|uniref:tetratricopeptide repeat protein n=1 Tax=Coleofasciculus sp. TaxID=3100458 RepID=UPI0039F9F294